MKGRIGDIVKVVFSKTNTLWSKGLKEGVVYDGEVLSVSKETRNIIVVILLDTGHILNKNYNLACSTFQYHIIAHERLG